MFCDKCGTPFPAGAQYCASCGIALKGVPPPPSAAPPRRIQATSDDNTRVHRHVNALAALWLANGILRLMGVGWLLIFRHGLFGWGWGWGWPFTHWDPGFSPFLWGGIFAGGLFLGLFGIVHLLLAWGLYERQPWARTLGIVVGILALIRFPLGTALGIYTLWVLAPERSAREYDGLATART